jgi:uncharacterized protein (DUF1778 family)
MSTDERRIIQRAAKLRTRGNFNLFMVDASVEAAKLVLAAEKEAKEAKESARRQIIDTETQQQEATQ